MSARLVGESTPIPGLLLLHRQPRSDERGIFERLYCADELASFGHPGHIAQANRSITRDVGMVRGLHYQAPPHADWKVIACLRGEVCDVVVDLRRDSPAFLRWHAVRLAGDIPLSLLVPPGCAHGFQVLRGEAELHYLHSLPYHPASDAGLRADDPRLAIAWPLPISGRSPRDAGLPLIGDGFAGVTP